MSARLRRMGLIVLRVDETIEHEFHRMLDPDAVKLHVTRVQSGDELSLVSIAQMGEQLVDAASLLPSAPFDVVGYACTSGTAILGAEVVAEKVKSAVQTRAVTNPLTAAALQIKELNLSRVGLISPYTSDVVDGLRDAFAAQGVHFAADLSFDEKEEAAVARIAPDVITQAARRLAQAQNLDGIFLSCTNLNTWAIRAPLAEELGVPVLSSNHALAWHMQRLCD